MKTLLVATALFLSQSAKSAMLSLPLAPVKVRAMVPRANSLIAAVEAATGLNFTAKCKEVEDGEAPLCSVNGYINTTLNSVTIFVYEGPVSADPRIAPVVLNKTDLAALIVKIKNVVAGFQ